MTCRPRALPAVVPVQLPFRIYQLFLKQKILSDPHQVLNFLQPAASISGFQKSATFCSLPVSTQPAEHLQVLAH